MTTLFYLMTVPFIIWELYVIIKSEKLCKFKDEIDSYRKGDPINTQFLIKGSILTVVHILYIIWAFIGLFSSNALYFALLFLLSLFTYTISKHSYKSYEADIKRGDAMLSLIILVSIFLRYFY